MSHESHDNPSHSESHGRPRYDDVNVPVVVLIGGISAVVTFLTIAFVQGLFYHWQATFEDNSPNLSVIEAIDAQKEQLAANKETGRLSIDETMKMIADEFAQEGEAPSEEHDGHGSDDHGSDGHGNESHGDENHDGNAGQDGHSDKPDDGHSDEEHDDAENGDAEHGDEESEEDNG